LGDGKGIWPVKTEWWGAGVVICLKRGADLHMAQLMPLLLTVSCFSKIQIGFTFLVLAYLGSPGKGPLNGCVCVGVPSTHPCTDGNKNWCGGVDLVQCVALVGQKTSKSTLDITLQLALCTMLVVIISLTII